MSQVAIPTAGNGMTLLKPLSHDFRVWPAFISGPSMFHAESRCLRATAVLMKSDAVSNRSRRSAAVSRILTGSRYTHAGLLKSGVRFECPVLPTRIAPTTAAPTTLSEPTLQARRRRKRGDDRRPVIVSEVSPAPATALAAGAVVR